MRERGRGNMRDKLIFICAKSISQYIYIYILSLVVAHTIIHVLQPDMKAPLVAALTIDVRL